MKKIILIGLTVLSLNVANADSCFISSSGSMGCSSWGTSSSSGKGK
ncbi:hypothetical protein [Poseidonibacter ostreae]|nr:hypothetical protein [Poseidonibacter ostreae]